MLAVFCSICQEGLDQNPCVERHEFIMKGSDIFYIYIVYILCEFLQRATESRVA